MKKIVAVLAGSVSYVCFASLLSSCGCTYKTVVCPATNNPVLYPASQRCIKTFYADAVKSYDPTFKGDINILDKIKIASVDFALGANAQLLKKQLESDEALIQEMLKSATIMLQQRPCDGDIAYKKALDDVANYRIRLETIKADVQRNQQDPTALKEVLDQYTKGKTEGRNVGIIAGSLDKYYTDNNKYPVSLSELASENARKAVAVLGLAVSYSPESNNAYTLRFAGQDGKLNTPDDKLHRSVQGRPVTE